MAAKSRRKGRRNEKSLVINWIKVQSQTAKVIS
jgi:hypothetical protein